MECKWHIYSNENLINILCLITIVVHPIGSVLPHSFFEKLRKFQEDNKSKKNSSLYYMRIITFPHTEIRQQES